MRPPGRRVPEIEHEHTPTHDTTTQDEDEYDIQQLIDEDQDLAQLETPPQPDEINIDTELASNKYLTLSHTGTTTADIDEPTTTQQGAANDSTNGRADQSNIDQISDEDPDNTEHSNTIALTNIPGKRRRVTTSARWENNALRQFKRKFDDDAEQEESVAWERAWERAPWEPQRTRTERTRRRTTPSSSDAGAGVTRDRENACTREGVT